MALDTLFQGVGVASGVNSYVQDVLADVTLPATSNSGLTDNSNTNPLGQLVGDNDATKYKVVTLWCRGITKNDGSLDYNSATPVGLKPTYSIQFHRTQIDAKAYVYGNPSLSTVSEIGQNVNSAAIVLNQINDGVLITGKFQRVNFLVESVGGDCSTIVDNGTPTSLTLDSNVANSKSQKRQQYYSVRCSASNQTNDLHTFQFVNLADGTIRLVGIEVYYTEVPISGPGTTFVNKNKSITTAGITLSVPSMGSSLGGIQEYIKGVGGGVTLQAQGYTNLSSIGTGLSGTNLLSMTTGTGASFPLGSILYSAQGTSAIYLNVTNQSTDTLTVSPTLSFGVSISLSKFGMCGVSQSISASTYIQKTGYTPFSFNYFQSGFTSIPSTGFTTQPAYFYVSGASSFLAYEGNFNAVEMDFGGGGILHGTFIINGVAAFGINQQYTSQVVRTVAIDLPNSWHTIKFQPGNSMGISLPIFGFRQYEKIPLGVSYGLLAYERQQVAFLDRGVSLGQSINNIGAYQRIYADSLNLAGNWTRGVSLTLPGGIGYYGTAATAIINFHYYGNQFSILGVQNGSSFSVTVDGVGAGATLSRTISPAGGEGWHQVVMSVLGGTAIVSGIEYIRSTTEKQVPMSSEQLLPSRMCMAVGLTAGGQTFIADTPAKYDFVLIDTHGSYLGSSSGVAHIPKTCRYRVSNNSQMTVAGSYYILINGLARGYLQTGGGSISSGTITLPFIAGDKLSIASDTTSAAGGFSTFGLQQTFSIEQIGD